jgi:hypothetical protein
VEKKTNLVVLAEVFVMVSEEVVVLGLALALVATTDVDVEHVPIKELDKNHPKEFKKTALATFVGGIADVLSEVDVADAAVVPDHAPERELKERSVFYETVL